MDSGYDETLKQLMDDFHSSIDVDRRLFRVDIRGSIAYARGLVRIEVITDEEGQAIIQGLTEIEGEIERGDYKLTRDLEDIHMAIEKRLIAKVGPTGGKLHTGRSRNDQIATDERLYLREAIDEIITLITACQQALYQLAERTIDVIFPGYTHLQQAQPIRFAHYAMAIFSELERDKSRFSDCRKRVNILPLGSGAMAGSAFPIDRTFLAQELGFDGLSPNSIDGVSDRDFIAEFISHCSILMIHVSRACEDIVIWSSTEFGYITVHPRLATGSSIMPQKKNPDAAELLRGKSGRVIGDLITILTVLKGLPHAYNKDMQEDKEPLFDALDTVSIGLSVFTALWQSMAIRQDRVIKSMDDAMLATDLADYLTKCGVPFREGHGTVAALVDESINRSCGLRDLPVATYQQYSEHLDERAVALLQFDESADKRTVTGGTAREAVVEQLAWAKEILGVKA
ncbi:MAG: argininosuccinate lyase [Candidatus Latescibacteria bacterium]|jgi:argininosuccinate lyase|nr:argininosuccinate lyase [Candidatus Latescibacterota bacterium]